jgi:SAM-dependent methyltransferase
MTITGSYNDLQFNEAYGDASVYDKMLPPHVYLGVEDDELLARVLMANLGAPPKTPHMRVLDIGAGPGRMTHPLQPYAAQLHGADKSTGMMQRFATAFPAARTTVADTESLLATLHSAGEAATYDLVSASWTLNYPLLECFEETTADGVSTTQDLEGGIARANTIIDRLIGLLADGGHLFAMFFDSETEEQQLVTSIWESISPFPGSGRGFTWELFRDGLFRAERARRGRLSMMRVPGWAVCDDVAAAENWFYHVHLNSFPPLIGDAGVRARIQRFATDHLHEDGKVYLPSAVHVVHFHASTDVNDSRSLL